ncbi:MAG: hypothetical protein ACOC6P_03225 [Candidatus Aminicenantaceae bacterium]
MRKKISVIVSLLFVFYFMIISNLFPTNKDVELAGLKENAPKVFIDCWRCDKDYFRTEVTYVNYVRDRKDADIHVLVTDQATGSGGREYSMNFIGLKTFEGMENTLIYVSNRTETRDEIREGMVDIFKKGLFPFLMKTDIADYLLIDFKQKLNPTDVKDKWDFWVFHINLDTQLDGETTQSSKEFGTHIFANRITPDLKIRLGISYDYEEDKYEYEDESITSASEQKNLGGLVVKSISDHWSVGGFLAASASTYSNIKSLYAVAPAIEFNIFPYSVSTRRQLRCLYQIGFNSVNYIEETIYEKVSEKLYYESLTMTLAIKEPWGSASTSLEGSHYFHDFTKNRFKLHGRLSFRIFKGFSMNIRGRYERIHDQLSLPLEDASLDEILLRRKELATDYDYRISVGISYTFGSVYSNVVNPRFGGLGYNRYY